ncbi:MAG: formate dehydrogenase subunit alpha [Fluviicoccus sp.]|uniref:formate dehydrogenase subunit alpha n=1 Tax=Fluviicoccus sp. TaxID=2003552 RepID=UPI0027198FA4|nr:formate dehydrogenase subunit alpha [Fluviicoccus sp.]MDO8331716.1 formate dehydrogenase subunit alpha [Fluviicoccus sp.]
MTLTTTRSICPFCGVGCGMGLRVEDNRVISVEPVPGHPVSQGQLCAKGWNAAFGVDPAQRITRPYKREGGHLVPVSWDEALSDIASQLKDFRDNDGPDSLGVISCARATNEDNYAAQKFARAVLQTPNIDHCARICHSPSVAGLAQTLGSGAMTNSMADVEQADLIVVWGADPTENHAVFGGRILRAKLNGAKLVVVDPRQTRLAKLADLYLPLTLGSNIALTNGLLHLIFREGWEDKAFLAARVDQVEALKQHVAAWTPERTAAVTGIHPALLRQFAELYARSPAAFLCYGMGITQFACGTNNVIALSNLVLACGQIGKPGAGINPLRGQNNVQGACDMGCLPNVYPGYQPVADAAVREKFSRAWNAPQPDKPGMTSLAMMHGARDGAMRAMIIAGEDPALTDPDQTEVARALKKLDLLVVLEMHLTETAKLADYILPVAAFAEKDGTFSNCERRVQRVRKAVEPPADCRTDWQIFGELARRIGVRGLDWNTSEAVFEEMCGLMPIFSAMSYARIDECHGLQWPCDAEHPDGSPVLHQTRFPLQANGRARMICVEAAEPAEMPDAEYPLAFTTQRLHFHYGCGSMTRCAPVLERETPEGLLFMHPDDAIALGLQQHSPVTIYSRRGEVDTCVELTPDLPPGLVSMPYHFHEAPCNRLTNTAQDPVTKMPELKACAVRVEKRSEA